MVGYCQEYVGDFPDLPSLYIMATPCLFLYAVTNFKKKFVTN